MGGEREIVINAAYSISPADENRGAGSNILFTRFVCRNSSSRIYTENNIYIYISMRKIDRNL